ncbi:MAG: putative bifunctional diguanylate cyclase/phosphodiesterase [Burkholderiaceae bacterium]
MKKFPYAVHEVLGFGIALLGAVVTVRWITDSALIATLLPGSARMGLNTPLLFLCAGLCCMIFERHPHAPLLRVCRWLLIALPALILFEHAFDVNLGIDFVRGVALPSEDTPHPGRVAPNTCIAFLCAGVALAWLNDARARKRRFGMLAIAVVLVIGVAALIGYVLHLQAMYRVTRYNTMLPPTAAGMAALGTALWLLRERLRSGRQTALHRIAGRITRTAAAVLTVVALVGGTFGFHVLSSSFEEAFGENLLLTATSNATSLANMIEQELLLARSVSTRPSLANALARLERAPGDAQALWTIDDALRSWLPYGVSGIRLVDSSGTPVAGAGEFTTGPDAVHARLLTFEGAASLIWRGDEYFLHFENPIARDGHVLGRISIEQRMPFLTETLTKIRRAGTSSDAVVCGREELTVVCPASRTLPASTGIPAFDARGNALLPIGRALDGESGVTMINDMRGVPVMSAYAPLATLGLGIVIKTDVEDFYAPLRERFNVLTLALTALIVFGTLVMRLRLHPLADATVRRLKESEERFRSLFEHHADAIFSRDRAGRVVFANEAMLNLSGYTLEELRTFGPGQMLTTEDVPVARHGFALALAGNIQRAQTRLIRKDGSQADIDSTYLPIFVDGHVVGVYAVLRDIKRAVEYERSIAYLASHDALTELPNRSLLHERLEHAIAQRRVHADRLVGVLFMDLNRFKMVNDSLGHDRGDKLLQMIAGRLKSAVREGDTVARLGGDEFVVVLEQAESIEQIAALADKLLAVVAQPFDLDGHELSISVSIGGSVYPKDGGDVPTLLKHADIAMYRAKELGSGTFRFFDTQMNVRMLDRLLTETGLRRALERGEFVIHYQPQVRTEDRALVGIEALIRWQHPERGLISPAEFIPLAEEIGLIGAIGEWVLKTACRQNRVWQQAGLAPVRVAVNLSAAQFASPLFAAKLGAILADTGLGAQWLELEITESSLMQNVDASLETLQRVRGMGVCISIDDFGTGYSSLSHLKRLPIDTLKIDQSFIRDVMSDPDDAAIVAATISLAHYMELRVVAEGVSGEAQAAFLAERGCDAMQGYLFSRPLPAPEAESFFHQPSDVDA